MEVRGRSGRCARVSECGRSVANSRSAALRDCVPVPERGWRQASHTARAVWIGFSDDLPTLPSFLPDRPVGRRPRRRLDGFCARVRPGPGRSPAHPPARGRVRPRTRHRSTDRSRRLAGGVRPEFHGHPGGPPAVPAVDRGGGRLRPPGPDFGRERGRRAFPAVVPGRTPDRLRVLRDAARRPLGADPRPLDGQRADGAADPASPSPGKPQLVAGRPLAGVLDAGARTVTSLRAASRQAGECGVGAGREGDPQDDLPRRRRRVSRGRLQPDFRGARRGRLAAAAHHRPLPPPEPAVLDSRRGTHRVLGEPATRRAEGTGGQRDPPGGRRGRRDPHPDLAARPRRQPGGLARRGAHRLSGLRRPLPGVPGHQALRHEPRRVVPDGGDGFARPGRRPSAVERGKRRSLLPVRRRGGHQGGVRAPRR